MLLNISLWCLNFLHVTILSIMMLLLVSCLLCLESTTPMLVYDGSNSPRDWLWW